MRVRDLRVMIDELRSIFTAAGAKPQDAELGQVSAALQQHDDEALDPYLDRVRRQAEQAAAPRAANAARRLAEAALNEAEFLAVLAEIETDKKLKKSDLQKVAELYVDSYDRRVSVPKLIDAIKLAFYAKLYDRDARAMARRATPV